MPSSQTPPKAKIDLVRRAQIGQEKRARTRSRILDVAFSLLGNAEGADLSIDQICREGGFARGTFYNHFTSIAELHETLSDELNHRFNRAVREITGAMASSAERVDAAIRYYLERAERDPQWGWAMVNISSGGPIFGRDTFERATRALVQGMELGEFDISDAQLGRDLLLGTTWAALKTHLTDPSHPSAPETASRLVLRALGVPPARVEEIVARSLPAPLATEPSRIRK